MFQPEKIIIADDHPLFRQALLSVLEKQFPNSQVLEGESVRQLKGLLAQHGDTDLLLLDLNIPDAHGFNTLVQIRSEYPELGVIIISGQEDNRTIAQSVRCGAAAFVPKSQPVPRMIEAVEAVMSGQQWLPEGTDLSDGARDGVEEKIASLSPRQHKILMMFADGLLNKQIAQELGLSEATIKAHASAIFLKLGVRTRTQAVIAMKQLQPGAVS
ncbi:response regulator [Ferrimonas futtsuensis]|uniref:response regulator transcription factor n=1 Tax=Ferrimonas futtsuensis TaxID=364764 RepID=UPI00040413A7|nr:response regulator transcription factor [Ferrimonas futtsuensis]